MPEKAAVKALQRFSQANDISAFSYTPQNYYEIKKKEIQDTAIVLGTVTIVASVMMVPQIAGKGLDKMGLCPDTGLAPQNAIQHAMESACALRNNGFTK